MQTNEQLKDKIRGKKYWVSKVGNKSKLCVIYLTDFKVTYSYTDNPNQQYDLDFKSFLEDFEPINKKSEGRKDDLNKRRYSLLPTNTINQVIDVLEYGASDKYEVDNWQKIPDARTRFYNAAMRHIDAWWNGELLDLDKGEIKGSQLPHLAHAVCCLLFLMWFDNKDH